MEEQNDIETEKKELPIVTGEIVLAWPLGKIF